MSKAYIAGTGMAVPSRAITNDDLSKIVDTSDEWIRTRTGIKERRISMGENTSDLAYEASKIALEDAGILGSDLDMIIVATITPDCYTPSVSCMLQEKLGAVDASCFDISAACSGFIYGLRVANQFIMSNECKNILVIGAEVLSKFTNWKDRNTCILFGDGAGAVVVKKGEKEGILSVITGASGEKGKYLNCPALPLENPFYKPPTEVLSLVSMDGKEVFKFATGVMVEAIERLLRENNLTIEDIRYIVPHQANLRILNYAANKLKIDVDRFFINLDIYGNTSAASVPMALHELNNKVELKDGDKLILVGFGGGLTWGGALIVWRE
ncbi:MAG TPA: beta-ketoacyl-ACP synthase III [Clostridiaceae bacterium]